MSDYTPITSEVREYYVSDHRYADGSFFESQEEHEAEFDRWLNKVKSEAILKAVTLTTRRGQEFVYVADILEYSRLVARGKA
jgi:hypothetical protein